MFKKIKKILNILNPQPTIGGLEISDSALKFVSFSENKLTYTSLSLSAGTVEEGKIKNKDNLKAALLKLHSQITSRSKKNIYVVVSIPDTDIYSQVFNLPMAATDNLEEAAKLNLQMLSPIDFDSAYSDWQRVGESSIDGGQMEILGAFATNKIVDDFVECLRKTNFVVAAIEFSGLALGRLASGLPNLNNYFLLLNLAAGGLNFALIKNYNLYFNHFAPWPSSGERQISLASVKEVLIKETQKILNFASSHWPESQIKTLLLATPALDEKLSQVITENFPFSVQKIVLPAKLKSPDDQWSIENNQLPSITSEWFIALGSALRGLIPRSKDIIISLSGTGTEEEFRQHQIESFINIWRNIILTSLSFILIAFIAVDIFLTRTTNSLNSQLANFANLPAEARINELQDEAKEFNNRVDAALKAKEKTYTWSPFFEKIKSLATSTIEIKRIFIQSPDSAILFNGLAINEQTIINFKNKLEKDPQFSEINFPLSSVVAAPDGRLNFSITFKLKLKA